MNVCSVSFVLGAEDIGGNNAYKVMAPEGIGKLWACEPNTAKSLFL